MRFTQDGLRPAVGPVRIPIEVPRVEYERLSDDRLGEPSAAIRERVEAASGAAIALLTAPSHARSMRPAAMPKRGALRKYLGHGLKTSNR